MSIKDLESSQQPMEVQLLKARFLQIQDQLLQKTPELPTILFDIHKNLLEHEEMVHLLDDEDIHALHSAFEIHKQQALLQKEIDKAAKGGKGKKKLSSSDLDNL